MNRKKRILVILCFLCALGWRAVARRATPATLVVLPDTQVYTWRHPHILQAQADWILRERRRRNIVGVIHVGDVTQHNTAVEWDRAAVALKPVADVLPLLVCIGNHDMAEGGTAADRTTRGERYFGPPRQAVQAGPFLLLSLPFGPTDADLAWANRTARQHCDRPIIVATHCYMNHDDTRVGPEDQFNPREYGCGGNDGEQIWQKFVRRHANIHMVLSGHILEDGLGRLASTGDKGNAVHQIVANYQRRRFGGEGYLRILTFHRQEIRVETYSPWRDAYLTDGQNSFSFGVSPNKETTMTTWRRRRVPVDEVKAWLEGEK